MHNTHWNGWRKFVAHLCLFGSLGGVAATVVAKDEQEPRAPRREETRTSSQPRSARSQGAQSAPRGNAAAKPAAVPKITLAPKATGSERSVDLNVNAPRAGRFQPEFQSSSRGNGPVRPVNQAPATVQAGGEGQIAALLQNKDKDKGGDKGPKNNNGNNGSPKPPKVEAPKPPKVQEPKPPKVEAPKPPKNDPPKNNPPKNNSNPPKVVPPQQPKVDLPKTPKLPEPKTPKVEIPKQPKVVPPARDPKNDRPDRPERPERDPKDRGPNMDRDSRNDRDPKNNRDPKAGPGPGRDQDRDRPDRLPQVKLPPGKNGNNDKDRDDDRDGPRIRPDRNLDPKVRREREVQDLAKKLEVPRLKIQVDKNNERLASERLRDIPKERLRIPMQKNGRIDVKLSANLRNIKPQREMIDIRLRGNGFQNLTRGRNAQAIRLDRQFALGGRGDVARQMNLFVGLRDRGGWQHRHFGLINRHYTSNCFGMWYSGPSYYGSYTWYPSWSGWVDSCWWDTCDPFWDPRPVFCRPVVYRPCPIWVHWNTPVWRPLPIVVCGTWIDVPPVVVQQADLQLLAVRFVDSGHPEQELGPRYRVWLRNNTPYSLEQPFNVMLLASNDRNAIAGRPEAGVRLNRMEAGETQVVDIRLPYASQAMGFDEDGRRIPFEFLHVLVDSHNEIGEAFKDNNGLALNRGDVYPVDPAAFAADPAVGPSGRVMTIAGEGFGPEPGQALVVIGGEEVQAEILGWYDLGVQVRLPDFVMGSDAAAEVLIVRGDGAAANPVDIEISPSLAYLPARPRFPGE